MLKPNQATPARWGRATFIPSGSWPVSLDLGGLDYLDLGKKLNMASLLGFNLILSRGGLRLLRLPPSIRLRTDGEPLEAGSQILFEQQVQLEDNQAKPIGTITFSALTGVPVPLVSVRYLGGQPEQRRKLVLLIEASDMGQATGEQSLERLRLLPLAQGVQIEHIPGHLHLSVFSKNIKPGQVVAFGQSIFIHDLGSRACLGVMDLAEP
jgi:hypothetical protein